MNMAKDLFFAQQTLTTLFSTTNKLQMQGDKQLQDITLRQMLAIPALIHAPDGKATINYLAKEMATTKQSAKQLVDALARKGYLSVAPSEEDKRAVNISVTAEGLHAFMRCSERTDAFLANAFASFSSAELETLCILLQKLYRFDGHPQETLNEHSHFNASDSAAILQHHPVFALLRGQANKKEPD
jgi:Transcriptional regulators